MNSPHLPHHLEVHFEKWHGAHNDFLFLKRADILKTVGEHIDDGLLGRLASALSSRLSGVGADGIVVWDTNLTSGSFSAGIWNSDGSRASTCGNALRCFGSLLFANGHWSGHHPVQILPLVNEPEQSIPFATLISASQSDSNAEFQASVDMGSVLEVASRSLESVQNQFRATFGNASADSPLTATFVQLANPHLVLHVSRGYVAERSLSEIEKLGCFFQSDEVCRLLQIPISNIGFIEVEANEADNAHAGIVYERGAGLTQCCGSGGCAMLLSSQQQSWFNQKKDIKISMPGGAISVTSSENGALVLSGPARKVGVFQASVCAT